MLETFVQKGEAVIVHSNISFSNRYENIRTETYQYPEITLYAKEKILMEDIRDFTYEIQKEGSRKIFGVQKIGVLICDDIAHSAQHALLKVLEDISEDTCIIIYTHVHSVFLSTVLSRVVVKHENVTNHKNDKKNYQNLSVAERFYEVKNIMKQYEEEILSKQDIITIIENIQKEDNKQESHGDIYLRAFSMLKQPSVSVKYVLEYVMSLI